MKKLFYAILLIFSCSCDDTLFNAGDVITKKIEIADFEEIFIEDIFDIYLIQDTICKIEVKAGRNLIPGLEFDIDNNKRLTIYNNNSARWSRNYDKIELYISVDTLKFMQLDAPSNVISQNILTTPELKILSIADYAEYDIELDCDNCYVVNSGTSGGIVKLKGQTHSFTFWARASFKIDAIGFSANYVKAKNESMADCSIHVNQELNVEILRTGNVFYTGEPGTINYMNEKAKEKLIKINQP